MGVASEDFLTFVFFLQGYGTNERFQRFICFVLMMTISFVELRLVFDLRSSCTSVLV